MALSVNIPRGTRDFGPQESGQRNYIIQVLKEHFLLYGFPELQTPAMENLETLTGKYGEEGDQLLFKILNSGLHEQKNKELLKEKFLECLEKPIHSSDLTDKALRYDLTVPFARYVSMHAQDLPMPFRRFQIQPVWRADRPQKGRYREFFQCDVDIIGTTSLISEWELIRLADDVFGALNIPAELRWNHRKVLQALAEESDCLPRFSEFTLCLDKWDKTGKEGVREELIIRNFNTNQVNKILQCIEELQNSLLTDPQIFPHFLNNHASGKSALADISFLLAHLKCHPLRHIRFVPDFTLARGLNYYTGFIFEAKALQGDFQPSILGGGRYDNLTGIFGKPGLSGVGISFGLDRIYDVMLAMNLFPDHLKKAHFAFCMGLYMDTESPDYLFPVLNDLRQQNIPCMQFPEHKKISKQFEFAEKCGIQIVLIAGESERSEHKIQVKDLQNKVQHRFSTEETLQWIVKHYEHFQHNTR